LQYSIFEAVHEGIEGVMESGTGRVSKVEGIRICGKTGTVENYYRGVKQPNHSFFAAFAPRENPKIAIMCVVENSGRFGGTYAAPIVSLLIEKYINDTISAKRKALVDRVKNTNLIPPLMKQAMITRDSLKRAREQKLAETQKQIETQSAIVNHPAKDDKTGKDKKPADSSGRKPSRPDMTTPDKQKLPAPKKDSSKTK
jgi:penicillin-binding protein 2